MTVKVLPTLGKSLGCIAACAVMGLSSQALATEFSADTYGFSAYGAPSGAISMRVTGPDGFAAESASLSYSGDEALPDGVYKYEITGRVQRPNSAVDVKGNMDQGRSRSARPGKATGVVESGHFRITNGSVVSSGDVVEPGTNTAAGTYIEAEPESRNFADKDG